MRRKSSVEGSSMDLPVHQANYAVLVWAKHASIHVFSLGGNADAGLEVCKREYILLRGPCCFVQALPVAATGSS